VRGSSTEAAPVAERDDTIRVALSNFRWPLDPALVSTRDETTLARAVYSTPLRTDATGRLVPGLCTDWQGANGFRSWTFRCRDALQIAAELRRVGRLPASPARWLFASARTITVPAPGKLVVRLNAPWRRFPYALSAVAAAPRGVPGPFRVVKASHGQVELADGATRLVFRRLTPYAAVRAFRRHEVDEAPVPHGDLAYLREHVRNVEVRRLLAQDVVAFSRGRVPLEVRRAYWGTANRGDYQSLVADDAAAEAFALIGTPKPDPAAFRKAVSRIPGLSPVPVRISVPPDPTLLYGARLLLGQWREVGLRAQLVGPGARVGGEFRRVLAPYPQNEALLGALGVAAPLGKVDQRQAFAAIDARNAAAAAIIPVCWVADARLVSPSLLGWQEDVLGNVDYTRVSRG
jgi:hypothetical protein